MYDIKGKYTLLELYRQQSWLLKGDSYYEYPLRHFSNCSRIISFIGILDLGLRECCFCISCSTASDMLSIGICNSHADIRRAALLYSVLCFIVSDVASYN